MVESPSGLILVTGPTGSGKSTTLAGMVDHVNRRRRCHILTIEDPIEYVHGHGLGAVNQREVGADTHSFARGLRSALREDPDVLMVGEMRDLASVDTVLTMAETGHLVFATGHTNDTSQAVDRVIGVFPGEQQNQARLQLSASLVGVIYQRLIPKIGGGLVAAYEILAGTSAVRNLIREANNRQLRNAITMAQGEGMQTLEMHLSRLVTEGVVDRDEVHPELGFHQLNGDAPLRRGKRTRAGIEERQALLEARMPGLERVLDHRPEGVPLPRLLDACVDLWTARRIAALSLSASPRTPSGTRTACAWSSCANAAPVRPTQLAFLFRCPPGNERRFRMRRHP